MPSPLVSIVIPTKNSAANLDACLRTIDKQTHRAIEVIVVDGISTDATRHIACAYGSRVLEFAPHLRPGVFDAPHKRNYGARHACGDYVYFIDADMELDPTVVEDAVSLCEQGFDAVIVPEDSFGIGVWAQAKQLERRCYMGDDRIEAPRFVRRAVWAAVGGLDETLQGGGDDWDFHATLRSRGFHVARTHSLVHHNEGRLSLSRLAAKRFMYGRDVLRYVSKRPRSAVASYFPFRTGYFAHWRQFVSHPYLFVCFVVMRTTEYAAGAAGVMLSLLRREHR